MTKKRHIKIAYSIKDHLCLWEMYRYNFLERFKINHASTQIHTSELLPSGTDSPPAVVWTKCYKKVKQHFICFMHQKPFSRFIFIIEHPKLKLKSLSLSFFTVPLPLIVGPWNTWAAPDATGTTFRWRYVLRPAINKDEKTPELIETKKGKLTIILCFL